MSNMTKERAAQIAAGGGFNFDEIAVLARIALASLEAEPVAYIIQDSDVRSRGEKGILRYFANISDEDINEYEITVTPLYAAPPSPVSVPEKISSTNAPEVFEIAAEAERLGLRGAYASYAVGWNACRAAMLQGADGTLTNEGTIPGGNSPVIPDGWVSCSERMPEDDNFVFIWPRPDFGAELRVTRYGKFDKRDASWYAQVCDQNYGIEYYPVSVTHWMPLPAAPQQEVK